MSSVDPNIRKRQMRFWILSAMVVLVVVLKLVPQTYLAGLKNSPPQALAAKGGNDKSDINRDGVVDIEDLSIYSQKKLNSDWQQVDWCVWLEAHNGEDKRLTRLYDFIKEYFQCGQEPPTDLLAVVHRNNYPTRLALDSNGNLYVTDAKLGSVFIYDPNLTVIAELKQVGKPLGVAVDGEDNIYVGNNENDSVDVYDPNGVKIKTIGQGRCKLPNDLAFDRDGNIYVVDSQSNVVWVYDQNGNALSNIGNGDLTFPTSAEISYYDDGTGQQIGEIYVTSQHDFVIKVFDLQGNLLRTFGGEAPEKWTMSGVIRVWSEGLFVKVQSLAMDTLGRLHASDCFMNKVQIFDIAGNYIDSYGVFGTAPGELNLPLDIIVNSDGDVIVANYENGRIEIIYTVP